MKALAPFHSYTSGPDTLCNMCLVSHEKQLLIQRLSRQEKREERCNCKERLNDSPALKLDRGGVLPFLCSQDLCRGRGIGVRSTILASVWE